MASRPQSTKIRAKRIALSYFKEPHPFRRWKFILSVAAPVVAGLWLLVVAVQGNQRVYNAGPVSTAHAMFEKDCTVCHGPGPAEGGPLTLAAAGNAHYWLNVSDRACQACHAGPRHATDEAFTPRCVSSGGVLPRFALGCARVEVAARRDLGDTLLIWLGAARVFCLERPEPRSAMALPELLPSECSALAKVIGRSFPQAQPRCAPTTWQRQPGEPRLGRGGLRRTLRSFSG